jgi:CBS domain containing-hemolysin-like protein
MTEAGHVLEPGDKVNYNGLLFEIDRVEGRRVITVRLELPADTKISVAEAASEGARAAG